MKKLLDIRNLKVDNVIDNLTLSVYEGVNVFLCGTSGSGKTLLLKAILGLVKYKGSITKKVSVGVVLDDYSFSKKRILDEFKYNSLKEQDKKIVDKFFSKSVLEKNPLEASIQTQKLIMFCKALLIRPSLIIVDNLFVFFDKNTRKKIYAYLKKENITLVSVCTDIEQSLEYQYMVVLNEGKVAIEGDTLQVLLREKILKRLGIGLPFYVDLSIQLKLYGLIDDVHLSKEKLVGALWK